MLHFFHTAPLPCCAFSCSYLVMFLFFSCCTLFMYCTISCGTFLHVAMFLFSIFTRCNVFSGCTLSSCTMFVLHYFQRRSQDHHKHPKRENFATTIHKALKYCYKALYRRYLWGPAYASTISMFYFYHVAFFYVLLFPCCFFSMMHFSMVHFFFHVVLFLYCTFFKLYFFHVALF